MSSPGYVVRTSRADQIAPEIRALVREAAPEAPMYRMYTMEQLAAGSMLGLSIMMFTLGIALMLALILGAVGLFGVLSYVVAERTQEIGVRMALGAKAKQIQRLVVAQGARVVILGVVIGVVVAGGGGYACPGQPAIRSRASGYGHLPGDVRGDARRGASGELSASAKGVKRGSDRVVEGPVRLRAEGYSCFNTVSSASPARDGTGTTSDLLVRKQRS